MSTSPEEARWLRRVLHNETVGGSVMLAAAALGLIFANSGFAQWYQELAQHVISVPALHLELTLQQWAADFLLALFFLVAGAELKHELTSGSLSNPRAAAVPALSALGGMAASILIFIATAAALGADADISTGWAIPSSTDIAFALAVLAIGGRGLHSSVRILLLSIAVVNDVGSILIIAVAFAHGFQLVPFIAAAGCVVAWAFMQRAGIRFGLAYAPVFLAGWYFMHNSGIHATIAGMAFGLVSSARPRRGAVGVEQVDRTLRPWVAGLAVPVFAFLAAGVQVTTMKLSDVLASPLTLAVIAGLVIGQPLGVALGMRISRPLVRGAMEATPAELRVVAMLAGVGFTVALLVSELTFTSEGLLAQAKIGVLIASVMASLLASIAMRAARR